MNPFTYKYQHIVIIDDSKMDILILKEMIQSLGYAKFITTFENPVNAFNFLKRCRQKLPDLIFINLLMPGIRGFQFIERCRRSFLKKQSLLLLLLPMIHLTLKHLPGIIV